MTTEIVWLSGITRLAMQNLWNNCKQGRSLVLYHQCKWKPSSQTYRPNLWIWWLSFGTVQIQWISLNMLYYKETQAMTEENPVYHNNLVPPTYKIQDQFNKTRVSLKPQILQFYLMRGRVHVMFPNHLRLWENLIGSGILQKDLIWRTLIRVKQMLCISIATMNAL